MLDVRPVRKGNTLVEIVTDLPESAEELIRIDRILMDREFDSQHVLEEFSYHSVLSNPPTAHWR